MDQVTQAVLTFTTTMLGQYSPWNVGLFLGIVLLALWIDLAAHKKDEPVSLKNAAIWSAVWIAVSLAFAFYLSVSYGQDKGFLFLTGYFLEKSLSVDNLFVFMSVFCYFSINEKYQHRVLYYGILGALILRMIFVSLGSSLFLIDSVFYTLSLTDSLMLRFSVKNIAMIVFGSFVLWSAYKMLQDAEGEEIEDYSNEWYIKVAKKMFPVHPFRDGHNFFTKQENVLHITPLFLCLLAIEFTDVAFAFDSVPAVISVTQEPFLVYTSNIFAILGLRSMYFLLAAGKKYLCHLEKSVIGILLFIGIKMLLEVVNFHIAANISLMVVLGGLTIGIIASKLFPADVVGCE